MIFTSFFKALGQIGDPRFRKVLLLGIGLTLALLIGSYAVLLWIIEALTGETTTLPIVGEVTWLGDLLSFGSFFLMLVLSIFLMVPVASAITSMFLETVAQAVEDKHYPHLPPAQATPFWEAAKDTVNFLGVIIGANTVALLLYAIFVPAAPFIFLALNGYLLGMEYFQLVAMRRVGRVKAKALRKTHRMTIWTAGILMALPLSIPIMNLVIPILGAATFTHIYHRLQNNA
jgi:CysZ protein